MNQFFNKKTLLNQRIKSIYNQHLNNTNLTFSSINDINDKRNINNNEKDIFIPDNKNCIFENNLNLLERSLSNLFLLKGDTDQSGIYIGHDNLKLDKISNYFNLDQNKLYISPNEKTVEFIEDKISIKGASRFNEDIIFNKDANLRDIMISKSLLNNSTYPFFGIIERTNNNSIKSLITFNPSNILSDDEMILLERRGEVLF